MVERLVGQHQQVMTALVAGVLLLCAGCGVAAVAAPTDRPPVTAAGSVTSADLREGLLGAGDLPAGFAPVTTLSDEDGGDVTFHGDHGCGELTRMLNAEKVPDAHAEAAVSLSNGPDGGAAAEQLFAMASPQSAARVVDRYRRAAARCPGVQLGVDGAGRETFALRQAPMAGLAEDESTAAVGATSEDSIDGQDIIQVVAHSGSVLVVTTFMGVATSNAEPLAQVALQKVRERFGA